MKITCFGFCQVSGKTGYWIWIIFFGQKPTLDQDRSNKKISQIGLAVQEEIGYIHTNIVR